MLTTPSSIGAILFRWTTTFLRPLSSKTWWNTKLVFVVHYVQIVLEIQPVWRPPSVRNLWYPQKCMSGTNRCRPPATQRIACQKRLSMIQQTTNLRDFSRRQFCVTSADDDSAWLQQTTILRDFSRRRFCVTSADDDSAWLQQTKILRDFSRRWFCVTSISASWWVIGTLLSVLWWFFLTLISDYFLSAFGWLFVTFSSVCKDLLWLDRFDANFLWFNWHGDNSLWQYFMENASLRLISINNGNNWFLFRQPSYRQLNQWCFITIVANCYIRMSA